MPTKRKPSAAVKAAADRAARRSEGKDPHEGEPLPEGLDPALAAEAGGMGMFADDAEPAPAAPRPARHPGGRPPEYRPEYVDIARDMCVRGATIAELGKEFDVSRFTIYQWMARYTEFANAIRIGREHADGRVGFSLYERAVGYTYPSVKIFNHKGMVVTARYEEHVPPDVGAAKHWLANRKPDEWNKGVGDPAPAPPAQQLEDGVSMDLARRVTYALNLLYQQQMAKANATDIEHDPAPAAD